jgi:hypothetical protein
MMSAGHMAHHMPQIVQMLVRVASRRRRADILRAHSEMRGDTERLRTT